MKEPQTTYNLVSVQPKGFGTPFQWVIVTPDNEVTDVFSDADYDTAHAVWRSYLTPVEWAEWTEYWEWQNEMQEMHCADMKERVFLACDK